ncbi:MAG: phosphoglycerate kinase [Actinobacteria bacterium]|nr:phosphoglycerate kinase [Actinomycetota bacterium]
MNKATVTDYPLDGARVLVRVDFNVPLAEGVVADDTRIRRALPTIELLTRRGCRVILVSHLGRPKGQVVDSLRLDPIAGRLSELLGRPVRKVGDCVGAEVEAEVAALAPGDVLLLENVRFHEEETANDAGFARRLASLADVFVNDAFGTAHRAHASTTGVAAELPAVAGLLMAEELTMLERLVVSPARPYVVVLGGAKVSDKVGVVRRMLGLADSVLVGGAMCFAFLQARGLEVGRSKVEEGAADVARELLDEAVSLGGELVLPADIVVAAGPDDVDGAQTVPAAAIPPEVMGLDIGEQTREQFVARIQRAGTVFWNGPMGLFEVSRFGEGTRVVATAMAGSRGTTVVGGGDTISALAACGLTDAVTYVSTGGGAALEFLEGKELPGVAALADR